MRTIENVYREYRELQGDAPAPRTPLEIKTAIEAAGLWYEGVSGPSFRGRLGSDWLSGMQAGHPFEDAEDELNAVYCDLAAARGLIAMAE